MSLAFPAIRTDGTVWEQWRRNAEKAPGREAIVHWEAGAPPFRWCWGDLMRRISFYSTRLRDMGLERGDVCAIVLRHHREFYPIYMAIVASGALPSVLAYPNPRLHPDKFRQGLEGMAHHSGLDWLLTERNLETTLRPLLSRTGSTIRSLCFPLEWIDGGDTAAFPADPDVHAGSSCLLQHSSGTTGLQKAVVLSNRAILEHVCRYGNSIGVLPSDKIVSWLPLYHDMGLIAAFYLPLTLGIPVVQVDPFEWVSAPVIFLEAISREKGTLSWLPNFAYNLMADRIREEDVRQVRLDSIRMLVNCSEPVRAESHERFRLRFAPYGLGQGSLTACYAMAETTFAVTQTSPGRDANTLILDRNELSRQQVRLLPGGGINARICTSSGIPVRGCEVRIVGDSGENTHEGQIGEIAIKSVSLFEGYRNDPEKTASVMRDGWHFSGDLGFIHGDELYVIGRKKDTIIVAGKNIYPEDIEDAVGEVEGVIPGRVIAFGIEDDLSGTEQICVVAETASQSDDSDKKLRLAIRTAAMQIDVSVSRVYLAQPRWLIKSSSGKPSRKTNRDRALAELRWR